MFLPLLCCYIHPLHPLSLETRDGGVSLPSSTTSSSLSKRETEILYNNTICLQYLSTKYRIVTVLGGKYSMATGIICKYINHTIFVMKDIWKAVFVDPIQQVFRNFGWKHLTHILTHFRPVIFFLCKVCTILVDAIYWSNISFIVSSIPEPYLYSLQYDTISYIFLLIFMMVENHCVSMK